MLVLAMESSRCAQRGLLDADDQLKTDREGAGARASGRRLEVVPARLEVRTRPGLPNRQGPRVTPSKRNSDAHCDSRARVPHGRDTRRCAVRQGGMVSTANSQ